VYYLLLGTSTLNHTYSASFCSISVCSNDYKIHKHRKQRTLLAYIFNKCFKYGLYSTTLHYMYSLLVRHACPYDQKYHIHIQTIYICRTSPAPIYMQTRHTNNSSYSKCPPPSTRRKTLYMEAVRLCYSSLFVGNILQKPSAVSK
jgi:hypothetical protein